MKSVSTSIDTKIDGVSLMFAYLNVSTELDCRIREMMEEEWFLERVLKNVLSESIMECRHVCKKWKSVCNKLAKSFSGSVRLEELPLLTKLFPNINRLDLYISQADRIDSAYLKHNLKSLRHLQSVRLEMVNAGETMESLMTRFNELSFLPEFEQNVVIEYTIPGDSTVLRRVEMKVSNDGCQTADQGESPTVPRNLRKLHIETLGLSKYDARYSFSSTTGLTQLELLDVKEITDTCYKVILNSADTLEVLDLGFTQFTSQRIDWSFLQTLKQLRDLTLTLDVRRSQSNVDSLVTSLETLNHLTGLIFLKVPRSSLQSSHLCRLRNLKSLLLDKRDGLGINNPCVYHFSQNTGLTKLKLYGNVHPSSFSNCTTLREVDLQEGIEETDELWKYLSRLPQLQKVNLESRLIKTVPSNVVACWTELRSLAIFMESIEDDFFRTLTLISGLTSLTFWGLCGKMNSDRSQSEIRNLSGLRHLHFDHLDISPLDFIVEGSFQKLRSLNLRNHKLKKGFSENVLPVLFRRMPSLMKVKLT